jgi:uncharacterized protein (TIGR00296 family)
LPFQLTQQEGETLVHLARETVKQYLTTRKRPAIPKDTSEKLKQPYGVFVTINSLHHGEKELRGCIGYPYPTEPLVQAVIDSAVSAATQDPRFEAMTTEELDNVVFEVSVLTPPEKIEANKPTEYPSKVKVGEDGLIVEKGMYKGLLLPQVPVEWEWNEEEFLCQTCTKAGLPPDCWLMNGTKIYKFSCIIAQETSPNGPVELTDMRGTETKKR